MSFKDRLIDLRKQNNLSQKDLAKKTGLTQAAISLWERGERLPNAQTILPLSQYFNVSVDYLLGNADDFGNIQYAEPKDELTPDERNLLVEYRKMTPQRKGELIFQIKAINEYEADLQKEQRGKWDKFG